MAIKQILRFPNQMLAKVADPVEVFDENISQLSADLRETAKAFSAEGLAATQVGSMFRMFVIKDHTTDTYITCINPQIIKMSTEQVDSMEGCLSFPGVNEMIKRAESVNVTYQDEGGDLVTRALSDVNAVAFQHELDHLNGVVFTEHMGKLQKRLALKKLAKVAKATKRRTAELEQLMTKQLRKFELAQKEEPATV